MERKKAVLIALILVIVVIAAVNIYCLVSSVHIIDIFRTEDDYSRITGMDSTGNGDANNAGDSNAGSPETDTIASNDGANTGTTPDPTEEDVTEPAKEALPDPLERIELRLGDTTENVEIGYIPEFDDMKSNYDIKAVYYSKDVPEGNYLYKDDLKWTTDNEDIAAVQRGTVMPKSEGTAIITAEYNGLKDSIAVIVKKDTFVEIELEYSELVLDKEGINNSHSRIYTDVKTLYGKKFEITNREETHWTAQNGNVEIIDGGIRAKEVDKDIVTVEFFGLTTTLNVEVKDRKIKEIRLTDEEITMSYISYNKSGENISTELLAELDDGTVLDISSRAVWSSDNPLVAEVNEAGYVYIDAVGVGETLIHAVYEDFHGTIKVKVKELKVKNVFLNIKDKVLYIEADRNYWCVDLTAEYEDGTTTNITSDADWWSEDPSVATVYEGDIKAVGEGETIIHADIDYLNYHETIKVIIKGKRN